jgi:formylglycine-generating enzyme required for sulfatase activity
VETVSWEDSQAWIAILNELIAPQAKGEPSFDFPLGQGKFSLPSEAQWEYAARGGIYAAQEDYLYAGSNEIEQVAWYDANAFEQTMPVGLKAPNQLGIYDMTGNVWEWCLDAYEADFYQKCLEQAEAHAQKVSKNPLRSDYSNTSSSVGRGGSYFDIAEDCRALFRSDYVAGYRGRYLGLRLGFFFFSS